MSTLVDRRTGEVLGATRLPVDQVRIMRRTLERAIVRARRDPRLSEGELHLLEVLERHQISTYGRGDLTVKEIALQLRRCIRTVRYRMSRLEGWGYVEIRERAGKRGGQLANVYRVRTPRGEQKTAEAAAERLRRRRERDEARKAPRPVEKPAPPAGGDCNPAHPPGPSAPRAYEIAPSGSGDSDRHPPIPGGRDQPPPHPAAADTRHGPPPLPKPRREEEGPRRGDFRSGAELLAHLMSKQSEGPNPGADP